MGSGGHNIKSVKEHKEKGNYRPIRHGNRLETISKPIKKPPPPPKDFDKDHSAVWVDTCARLCANSLLTDDDLDIIRIYCETTILRRFAILDLQKNGMTYETENGALRPNPSSAFVLQFTNVLMAIMDRFGFNPKSRQALKKVEPEKLEVKDPFAMFLSN